MKKLYSAFVAVAAVAAVSLGGCASVGTSTPVIDNTQLTNIENQIQQTTASVCGFVPTIGTIASIVTTFTGGGAVVDLASQVANSICKAVVPVKAKLVKRHSYGAVAQPAVNGVKIEGYFIR